jgi:hypothetical protein
MEIFLHSSGCELDATVDEQERVILGVDPVNRWGAEIWGIQFELSFWIMTILYIWCDDGPSGIECDYLILH